MKLSHPLDFLQVFQTTTRERYDWINPLAIATLATIGVFFIYSAQLATNRGQWIQQVVWLAGGRGPLLRGFALVDYKFWLKYAHWVYAACLVSLLLPWTPLGVTRLGARRWIDFGPISFQPSEAAKFGALIITAAILTRSKLSTVAGVAANSRDISSCGRIAHPVDTAATGSRFGPCHPAHGFCPALRLQSFAALFRRGPGGVCAADRARRPGQLPVPEFPGGAQPVPSTDKGAYEAHGLLPLHDYQRNRILAFVAPDRIDPMGISWNLNQSLISVGSGGLTGKGWTQGTQAKLRYLPEAHTDFIFSVLAEEKGFLGSISVLGLFGVVLWNGIRIAGLARDRFGTLLALGVTVLFAVHVFVNIAMTIGLVPITGIPLPFISYGGSFVLSCCVLQGLVQSVYRFRKEF